MNVTCPRCRKMFEHPGGSLWTTCPHCGAANTDAVAVVKNLEREDADDDASTAISARPLPDGRVTCSRCGKRFDRPDDPAIPWLSCPFCHEVNPNALVKRTSPRNGMLGGCLIALGVLGVTVGTLLCWLGMTLDFGGNRPTRFRDIAVTVLWAAASLAIMATGIFFISSENGRAIQKNYWGPGAFFLVMMLLGFAGWIFAFATCSFDQ